MRITWLILLGMTLGLVTMAASDGEIRAAIITGAIGAALTWWFAPWQGGRTTTHREAIAERGTGPQVIIYWRPACIYCARLKGRLGKHGKKAIWVNIWQDLEAAAYVRSVNDGNETVPTVVIGEQTHTNPDPQLVLDHILAHS